MKAYKIDNKGFLSEEIKCQESPLEPGKYLLPAGVVTMLLPPLAKNETVRWTGNTWVVEKDFSGKTYYNKADGSIKLFSKGEKFSDIYIEDPPPSNLSFPRWQNNEWIEDINKKNFQLKKEKRALRDAYLTETDRFLLADFPILPAVLHYIKQYRSYLREIPQAQEGWEYQPVLTLEEWKNAKL